MMIRAAVPLVLLLATQCLCQQWLFSNIGNFNPISSLFGGGNSEGFSTGGGGGGGFGGNVFSNSDFPMETSGSEPSEVFLRTVYMPNFFGGGGGGGGGGNRGLRVPIIIRGPPPHEQDGEQHQEGPPSLGSHPFPSFSNFPEGAFSNEGPRENGGPNHEGNFQGPFLGADSIQGPPPNFQQGPPNNFNQGSPNNFEQGPSNHFGQPSSNNFDHGPSNNFEQGSSNNFQHGPNNFQQGPNNFQQGPNNFQQGPPQNFMQGPPQNFQQGPPHNFQQGPPQNFEQQGRNEFHQGPPPNFQQGASHQNFQQDGNSGGFRIEGPFSGPLPQFSQFNNQNNEGQQGGSSPQPRGIPIPVSGNVIPVKVQMPQAHGQPIIQNALLLLVPPNIPIQGETRFQGNLAAAAAAAGRAAFQVQQQNNRQNQNQHQPLERGFRPMPPSVPVKNHPNHQMESSIQYHQAHDLPRHGGYVPFSPSTPQKILKPLQAKKFLASTQKGNQGSSSSHQKKYVSLTSSDAKPSNGEVIKKVVRVTQSSNQQKVTGRSMPIASASSASTTVIDLKPAASVEIKTNVTAPANKTLSG